MPIPKKEIKKALVSGKDKKIVKVKAQKKTSTKIIDKPKKAVIQPSSAGNKKVIEEKSASKTKIQEIVKKNTDNKIKIKNLTNEEICILIKEQAYNFFIERGCTHGNDLNDWYMAEQAVSKYVNIPWVRR
ncbi:hypothetical protein OMAG_001755 [Candidatus Omnitrophus magneticus]|uniref:DUF2934 domain-containing protein n=1 Tax=Candidatus Omnitrophus magneticus TaxID=1609969 RepID=A0A0F0CM30_9BACT|nr:hypothetical protein OMAG_001755 [Candidatus Omnitrophus magneticus]